MHCNQEQIEALLDGELTGPEGDAVLAHLRDCPGCRSYYRQLLAMEQALRADTDPVPEDLLADIMSRVHDTPQRGGGSRGCGLPWAWRRVLWWYCVSIWCISRRKRAATPPSAVS